MSVAVTIRDQRPGGAEAAWTLELLEEQLTVRELIRSRVYQEVQDYNTRRPARFNGLVQPSEAERALNGVKVTDRPPIDWKKQFERALEAFASGGFILLVNDQQMDSLDEDMLLAPETTVTFLKLVPLVGG